MLHAIAAALLIAQTLIVPMTGARARSVQTETLFHTLFHDFYPEDDRTTYVQTGDIPAMWLRDSSAQTIPYVRFQRAYPLLRNRFAGVIERNARAINLDVYANAFQENYHAWERKWEVDSIAWPVVLLASLLRRDARPQHLLAGAARCAQTDRGDLRLRRASSRVQQVRVSLSRPDEGRVRRRHRTDLGRVPSIGRSGRVSLQYPAERARGGCAARYSRARAHRIRRHRAEQQQLHSSRHA